MPKATKAIQVYLNPNKVDELVLLDFIDSYNASMSSLFKAALKAYIDEKKISPNKPITKELSNNKILVPKADSEPNSLLKSFIL